MVCSMKDLILSHNKTETIIPAELNNTSYILPLRVNVNTD